MYTILYGPNLKIWQLRECITIFEGSQKDIHILLSTKVHLKNVYYLYSACSNPTNVVLVIGLSMIIGKGAWYWDR